jgi:hypothetical protein
VERTVTPAQGPADVHTGPESARAHPEVVVACGAPPSLVCHPQPAGRSDAGVLPLPGRREKAGAAVRRLQDSQIFRCIAVEWHLFVRIC